MAKIQDNTNIIKPRISSCFLGCFGFSTKISKKKISHDVAKSGTRKNSRWLSLSRFRTKKSIGKTVPIDTTVSENITKSREIHTFKSDEIVPVLSQDQNANDKPRKKRYEEFQHMALEARKSSDSVKGDTCQKELSSTRKKEAKRTGPSHPCSPDNQSKVGVSIKKLSHSVSLTKPKPKRDVCAGKLDPAVGMSIIMVTLIIMVVWGKLCAILCTSAWFYFVPRLRKSVERNVITVKNELISGVDVNSVEYKKKVVLEGLLQRKHRNVVGFS